MSVNQARKNKIEEYLIYLFRPCEFLISGTYKEMHSAGKITHYCSVANIDLFKVSRGSCVKVLHFVSKKKGLVTQQTLAQLSSDGKSSAKCYLEMYILQPFSKQVEVE